MFTRIMGLFLWYW